jgi:hypothetical protein
MATSRIVQARIDAKTARLLARLRKQTGLTDSELVRRGIELMSNQTRTRARPRILGIGMFKGPPDLSTNPRYMEGFGRS